TDRMDEIEELGFSAITLSPIMQNSPDGYHGYWIEDIQEVDEHVGTMEDFDELIEEAHKRDITIILELVTNYVGPTNSVVTENPGWISGQESDEAIHWMDEVDVLDQTNPAVEQFLFDVADFWMDETAIDGYKLHAADEANEVFLHELTTHIKEKDADFLLIADILKPESDTSDMFDEDSIDLVEDYTMYK